MQYVNLGRTGLRVSRLCLGTMNYGPYTSQEEAHTQMDKALELGINFFDTADTYGGKRAEGITEQIIGNWFAKGGGRRDRTILATKVFADMELEPGDVNMKRGLSALKIRRACENSLKRLKTDHIDLYQMHHIDRAAPWEEIWQAFELLVQQGKAVYVGSSNFAGWHIATAQSAAKNRNFFGLVSEQSKYSLITRDIELEVLPACQHFGMGVIAYSPLEAGALSGAMEKIAEGRHSSEYTRKAVEKARSQLERWEEFCRQLGQKPADVALAWMLQHPAITAPIIGPRTMDQLVGSLRALEIKIDDEVMKQLDQIFPGPHGPKNDGQGTTDWTKYQAPEAYAW